MKNLKSVSLEEQKEFFNSFDQILCDLDGKTIRISEFNIHDEYTI